MQHTTQIQNIFYIWHYSLYFSSISIICVFIMDMMRLNTHSISTLRFSAASIAGVVTGIALMDYFPADSEIVKVLISTLTAIIVSVVLAYRLQTRDKEY